MPSVKSSGINHLELIRVLTIQSHLIKQDHDTEATCNTQQRVDNTAGAGLHPLPAAHGKIHCTLQEDSTSEHSDVQHERLLSFTN